MNPRTQEAYERRKRMPWSYLSRTDKELLRAELQESINAITRLSRKDGAR